MPSDNASRQPGRIRTAIAVLMGAPVVPAQIRAEWAAVQLELEAICDKIAAAANRLNTRHKRDLDRALEELEEYKAREADPMENFGGAGSISPARRALSRRALAMRGRLPQGMNGGEYVAGAETE